MRSYLVVGNQTLAGPALAKVIAERMAQGGPARFHVIVPATPVQRGLTWDEGDGSDNHVLTLAIEPNPREHASSHAYDHYSLLATVEDRLGLARLGKAADTSAMTDLVTNPGP